jgi:hypothetical protein
MYSQIIGTQQIVVTVAFLAAMIVVLIVLRSKGGIIRASLKAGKRVAVVEDTAVSPTERLRLISIDDCEFIMLSAKGQQPTLVPFVKNPIPSHLDSDKPASVGLGDIKEAPERFAPSSKEVKSEDVLYPSDAEREAFIEKFQTWRRDHAAG